MYRPSVPFHGYSLPISHPFLSPNRYYGRPIGYPIAALRQLPAQSGRPAVAPRPSVVVFGVGPHQQNQQPHSGYAGGNNLNNGKFLPQLAYIPPLAPAFQQVKPIQNGVKKPIQQQPNASSVKLPKTTKQSVSQKARSNSSLLPVKPIYLRPGSDIAGPLPSLPAPTPIPSPTDVNQKPAELAQSTRVNNNQQAPVVPAHAVATSKIPGDVPGFAVGPVHSTIYAAAYTPGSSNSYASEQQKIPQGPIGQEIPAVTLFPEDQTTPAPTVVTVTPESIVWPGETSVGQPTELSLIQPAETESSFIDTTERPSIPTTTQSTASSDIRRPESALESTESAVVKSTSVNKTEGVAVSRWIRPVTPTPLKPHSRPSPKLKPYTRVITSTTTASPSSAGSTTPTSRKPYYNRVPSKDRPKTYTRTSTKQPDSVSPAPQTAAPAVVLSPSVSPRNRSKSSYKRPSLFEKNPTEVSAPGKSIVTFQPQQSSNNKVRVTTEPVTSVETPDINFSSTSASPASSTSTRMPTEPSAWSELAAITEATFTETTFAPAKLQASFVDVISGQTQPPITKQSLYSQSFFNTERDPVAESWKSSTVKPISNKQYSSTEKPLTSTSKYFRSSTNDEEKSRTTDSWFVDTINTDPYRRRPEANKAELGNLEISSTLAAAAVGFQAYDHSSSGENDDGDYSAIPGEPGVDYPIYSEAPNSQFNCSTQRLPGYYADVPARCQLFHVCLDDRQWSFLCPNGTIFSQQHFVCVWWYEFDCSQATGLYSKNEHLFQVSAAQQVPEGHLNRKIDFTETKKILEKKIGFFHDEDSTTIAL